MIDTTARNAGLRQMLCEHRRDIQDELQSRIRHGRAGEPIDGHDDLERTDLDTQGDIRFALLEMRAETLTQIDAALSRLDVGEYGTCFDCAGDIEDQRLRAAPFAVRCRACEEKREHEQRQTRQLGQGRGGLSPVSVAVGF